MDRERAPNRWQDWRFTIAEVVADEDAFGAERARPARRRQGAAHPLSRLHARAARRRGRGLLPQPQLGRAGLVRRLANRRRRPVARLARNGERVVHRSRPLARRAGAGRQRAAAAPNSSPGCRPTPTSTTGRKRRSRGAGRSRSSRRRSASDGRRRLPVALGAPQGRMRAAALAGARSGAPRPRRCRPAQPVAPLPPAAAAAAGADGADAGRSPAVAPTPRRRCRRSTTSPRLTHDSDFSPLRRARRRRRRPQRGHEEALQRSRTST